MTRAEAIERLEKVAAFEKEEIKVLETARNPMTVKPSHKWLDTYEMAIAALKEQEEREQGCEYCRGEKELYQHTHTMKLHVNTFGAARTLEVECVPCPPYANCCMKEVPARSAFLIRYCPECGRKLDGGEAE